MPVAVEIISAGSWETRPSLLPMVDEKGGGKLINRIIIFRRQYAQEMGFVIDGVAVDLRHLLVLRQDPPGGDAVGRLHGLDAVDLAGGGGGLQSKVVVHQNLARSVF